MAEQWLIFKSADLVTKSVSGFTGALDNHVLPAIGDKPVTEIKLEHITNIITELRRKRIMAMATRVRTIVRAVLGLAEGRGRVERNVALSNIEELKIRHVVTTNPAIERPADLGKFLVRLDDCCGGVVTTAMRMLVMLRVRPGELVKMRWEDVELIGADWRYVVSKTKHLNRAKHIVPLPEQALVLLRELARPAWWMITAMAGSLALRCTRAIRSTQPPCSSPTSASGRSTRSRRAPRRRNNPMHLVDQNSVEQLKAEVSLAMAAYYQSLSKCSAEESAQLEQTLLEKIAMLSAYAQLVTGGAVTVQ